MYLRKDEIKKSSS